MKTWLPKVIRVSSKDQWLIFSPHSSSGVWMFHSVGFTPPVTSMASPTSRPHLSACSHVNFVNSFSFYWLLKIDICQDLAPRPPATLFILFWFISPRGVFVSFWKHVQNLNFHIPEIAHWILSSSESSKWFNISKINFILFLASMFLLIAQLLSWLLTKGLNLGTIPNFSTSLTPIFSQLPSQVSSFSKKFCHLLFLLSILFLLTSPSLIQKIHFLKFIHLTHTH